MEIKYFFNNCKSNEYLKELLRSAWRNVAKESQNVLYMRSKKKWESGRTKEEMEEQCQEISVGIRRDQQV